MLSFIWPLSKMNKKGTLRMLNLDASIGLASTFNFPTLTFPLASEANSSMIGAAAEVLDSGAKGYHVLCHGETWSAVSDSNLTVGQKVQVTELHGLVLHVKPIEE